MNPQNAKKAAHRKNMEDKVVEPVGPFGAHARVTLMPKSPAVVTNLTS